MVEGVGVDLEKGGMTPLPTMMTNQLLSCPNAWGKITQNRAGISLQMLHLKCLSICKCLTYDGIKG